MNSKEILDLLFCFLLTPVVLNAVALIRCLVATRTTMPREKVTPDPKGKTMLDIIPSQIERAPNVQNDVQARLRRIESKLILLKLNPELLQDAERLDQIAQFSTSPKDGPIIVASLKETKPEVSHRHAEVSTLLHQKTNVGGWVSNGPSVVGGTLSQGIANAFAGDTAKIHEAIFGASENAVFGVSTWRVSSAAINVCPGDRIKIDGRSPGFAPGANGSSYIGFVGETFSLRSTSEHASTITSGKVALLFQGENLISVPAAPEVRPKAFMAATHRFG